MARPSNVDVASGSPDFHCSGVEDFACVLVAILRHSGVLSQVLQLQCLDTMDVEVALLLLAALLLQVAHRRPDPLPMKQSCENPA